MDLGLARDVRAVHHEDVLYLAVTVVDAVCDEHDVDDAAGSALQGDAIGTRERVVVLEQGGTDVRVERHHEHADLADGAVLGVE